MISERERENTQTRITGNGAQARQLTDMEAAAAKMRVFMEGGQDEEGEEEGESDWDTDLKVGEIEPADKPITMAQAVVTVEYHGWTSSDIASN